MSQNTCERSGFRKYKPRVQYFDLTIQNKMVRESEGIWSLSGGPENRGPVILRAFSPRTL